MAEIDTRSKRLTFDPTINAGHVLTFVMGVALGFGAWSSMDKRVVVLEEARTYQKQRDDSQDSAIGEKLTEVRDSVRELRRSVDDLRRDQKGKP